MTQEDKQLLLKDLCARLPYGVKYCRESWNYEWDQEMSVVEVLEDIDKEGYINYHKVYKVWDIKPYLRPMSSMTEKEWREFNIFTGKTETYTQQIRLDADSIANPAIGGYKCVYWSLFDKCIDWLNAHNFDYRGLIEKGLALEAPEGMYK